MRLYGDLERFGGEYRFQVDTLGELFRALFSQLKGFRQAIQPGYYRVRTSRGNLSPDRLDEGMRQALAEDEVVHIVPVAAGGKGLFEAIAGVALVVVGVFTANPYLVAAGIGIGLMGIAQMLTPIPQDEGEGESDAQRNTTFSNIDNVLPQGRPVPVAYGRVYAGSLVLSQGLYSE